MQGKEGHKLKRLKKILQDMRSVVLAYSGGVDSTFLLKIAKDVLKDQVLAVIADSPTYPKQELAFAKIQARALGAKHKVVSTAEFQDRRFSSNPLNRCYFCKKELFYKLKDIAIKKRINFVIDASNLSDKKDFRPGDKAKKELKVRSPLQEAGFTKQDIRKISRKLKLLTWNKPSLACLASRIPYGTAITPELLRRINHAEEILRGYGFSEVRVRHYNGLCRIEVAKDRISRLLTRRKEIIDKFKDLGYNYVTVDLEGFRSGSMNPVRSLRAKTRQLSKRIYF